MNLRVLRGRRASATAAEAPAGPAGPTPPWRRLLRPPRPYELRAALRRNAGLKLMSLLLAFFLWFSINVSERDAEGTIELPLRVRSITPGLIVTQQPTKPVSVTVRGPRTILDAIDEHRTGIALDLSEASPGEQRQKLKADMIRPELPRRLKVVRLEPTGVRVRLERVTHRRLPVKVELGGILPLGYTAEPSIAPSEVDVTGPASKVGDLKEIKTEPLELRGTPETVQRNMLLSWAGDFVSFTPDQVTVRVTFQPTLMVRKFEHVEVAVRNVPAGARAKVVPARIDLILQGPQRVLSNYELEDGSVWIDATGLDPGIHRVTPKVDVPQSLEATRREPELLTLEIGSSRAVH